MRLPSVLTQGYRPPDAPREPHYFVEQATSLLDKGQVAAALDCIGAALAAYPENLTLATLAARALILADSLEDACELLEELIGDPALADEKLEECLGPVRRLIEGGVSVETLLGAVRAMDLAKALAGKTFDEESLGLLASARKALWLRTGETAHGTRSLELYRRAFKAFNGPWAGINAATLARVLGDPAEASALAHRVLEACDQPGDLDPFWLLASQAEALFLLGRHHDSAIAYRGALEHASDRYAFVASARRQLRLLASHGVEVPEAVLAELPPPTVVVFAGPRVGPGTPSDESLQEQISRILEQIDGQIGFSSASCGSEILFAEALNARGGETHLLIPFETADFESRCVAYAGKAWSRRFGQCLKLAASVTNVTQEPMLDDSALFVLLGRTLAGVATLQAERLEAKPHLIWIRAPQDQIEVDLVDKLWPSGWPRHEINLKSGRQEESLSSAPAAGQRQIRAFLFCDVYHYTRLDESAHPAFMHYLLERIAKRFPAPEIVNTAGDGLFASSKEAVSLANYALGVNGLVRTTDWSSWGLPPDLQMRFALHAGPAYEMLDPFTGRPNVYGSHVNRAARMEPVTVPGQVYASEQFMAVLTSEFLERGHCEFADFPIRGSYIGPLSLAKAFGRQNAYRLYRSATAGDDSQNVGQEHGSRSAEISPCLSPSEVPVKVP